MLNAGHFRSRIASVEQMEEMEIALWDMIAPIAKQDGDFGIPPHAGETEGKLVWRCLLEISVDVARLCYESGRADVEKFQVYRACKEKVIQDFRSLCVASFRDTFIKPLLISLNLYDKYTE